MQDGRAVRGFFLPACPRSRRTARHDGTSLGARSRRQSHGIPL